MRGTTRTSAPTRAVSASRLPRFERAELRICPERSNPAETERGLWHNSTFVHVWGSETISLLGSKVTLVALPLTAVLTLNGSAAEIGLLNAALFFPYLLFSVPLGVLADRRRRISLMMISNLGRALLLGSIPLAASLHLLSLAQLYVVAFAAGTLTVLFDLAWQTALPALVRKDQIAEANAKLMGTSYAIEVGGPGLGGVLVQVLTAPFAIVVDSLSYLVAGAQLASICRRHAGHPGIESRRIPNDITVGMRLVFGNPLLRAIGLEGACSNLLTSFIDTLFLVYAVRILGMSPALLGVCIGTASAGALIGSIFVGRLTRAFRLGPCIVGSMLVACLFPMIIPLAGGPLPLATTLIVIGFIGLGTGTAVSSVLVVSLRQRVTPQRLLGRMNASYRMLVSGTIPVGAALGGLVGNVIGLRTAMLAGAVALCFAPLWVILSPVARLATLADEAEFSI